MYKVTLSNVNKKTSRMVNGLKKGQEYSLKEADNLLKEIQRNTKQPFNIFVGIIDDEEDQKYEFDKLVINPQKSLPDLLEAIEEELLNEEGLEDSFKNRLLMGLEKQFQEELFIDEQSEPKQETKKSVSMFGKKKKKGSQNKNKELFNKTFDTPQKKSFGLFGKRKIVEQSELPKQENYSDEFTELDLPNNLNDFSEVEALSNSGNYEVEEEIEESNHDNSIDDDEEYDPFGEKDFKENHLEQENNYEGNIIETKIEQKANSREVYFPEYDKFLDMSSVDSAITRQNERLEKEHLVKFLGLNALSEDSDMTELDTLKLNYALNSLEESKFMIIKDYFNTSVQDIKDKTQNGLSQIYDQAMAFDYREESKRNLEEELEIIENESKDGYLEYKEDQEKEYNQKLNKFNLEQEKALQNFKREQEIEHVQFIQELDNKKQARMDVFNDNTQRELIETKEELVEEKVIELKYNSINSMTEAKRISIRQFEAELDNAVDDTWEKTQSAIEELKLNIQKRIPEWKIEIEENRKMKQDEREEARKEKGLELERKRIALQQKQLEYNKTKKVEDEGFKIAELLEKKLTDYDEIFAKKLQSLEVKPEAKEEKQLVSNSGGLNFKRMFTASVIVLIAGGGLVTAGIMNKPDRPVYAQTQEQAVLPYAELMDSIKKLEEKIETGSEEKKEQPSLEILLEEKSYEKAISLYKESESLEKIEETLYENEELAYLVTFNKANETKLGKIDEAILSKDNKQVFEQFKKLSEDVVMKLTQERKNEIALSLYQINQNEVANKLMAKGETK